MYEDDIDQKAFVNDPIRMNAQRRRENRILVIIAAVAALSLLGGCGQPDKLQHFVVGAGAATVAKHVWPDQPLAPCAAAIGVGLAKEAWDARGNGNVEALDAIVTGVGCVVTIEF